MVRMRPLLGSTTTTLPFTEPRAFTAAWRTVRSSASKLSPRVGSILGAVFFVVFRLRDAEARPFFAGIAALARLVSIPATTSGTKRNFFMQLMFNAVNQVPFRLMEQRIIITSD